MKTCKKCKRVLPLDNFYVHPQMSDGRLNFCAECVRERVRKQRTKNVEHYREYDRQRGLRVYDFAKRDARNAVNNAITAGKMQRENCWCGEPGQAHHPDHNDKMHVVWLCRTHHGQEHTRIGRELIPQERSN